MSWATPQDIRDRWVGAGAPTEDKDSVTNALIADAEAVILSEFPLIQNRIDGGSLAASVVTMVVCRMVTRVFRNPENLTYWQQSTGPFGQGRSFGTDKDIWLSSEEREMLAPKRRGKAFEVDLAPNALPGVAVGHANSDSSFSPYFGFSDSDD